jgi:hypothetical protein
VVAVGPELPARWSPIDQAPEKVEDGAAEPRQ